MVNTSSPELRAKVRAHIKSMMNGSGGMRAAYEQIDDFLSWENNYFRHNPYLAAMEYAKGGAFLIYTDDVEKQLKRWGFTDNQLKIRKVGPNKWWSLDDTYFDLVSRELASMYEEDKQAKMVRKGPSAVLSKKGILERTFSFGKIDYDGIGRRVNLVKVEVNIYNDRNPPMFAASGEIRNARDTDSITAGQMLDQIKAVPENNDLFQEIKRLWSKYHLKNKNNIPAKDWERILYIMTLPERPIKASPSTKRRL